MNRSLNFNIVVSRDRELRLVLNRTMFVLCKLLGEIEVIHCTISHYEYIYIGMTLLLQTR